MLLVVLGLSLRTVTYELRSPGMWELRVAEGELARGDVEAATARIARAREVGAGDPAVERRIELLFPYGPAPGLPGTPAGGAVPHRAPRPDP